MSTAIAIATQEMSFVDKLFSLLQRDIQIEIAVKFVGGWKYTGGKLVFDYDQMYSKIPRIIQMLDDYTIVYSRGFNAIAEKSYQVKLPIINGKSYVLMYDEDMEYKEHEYTLIEIKTECGNNKTVIVADYRFGHIWQNHTLLYSTPTYEQEFYFDT